MIGAILFAVILYATTELWLFVAQRHRRAVLRQAGAGTLLRLAVIQSTTAVGNGAPSRLAAWISAWLCKNTLQMFPNSREGYRVKVSNGASLKR
jgi:hypothetical protein